MINVLITLLTVILPIATYFAVLTAKKALQQLEAHLKTVKNK